MLKYFIFVCVVVLASLNQSSAQIAVNASTEEIAGPDGFICKGNSFQIGTCLPGNFNYTWISVPFDPSLVSTQANPIVSPTTSTIYYLTINGDLCLPCDDHVIVNVLEQVSVSIDNGYVECMEGQEISYSGSIKTKLFPDQEFLFRYRFLFEDANGNQWEKVRLSNQLATSTVAHAGTVPTSNSNHFFFTPIDLIVEVLDFGTNCRASNPVTLQVWELWIDYVRDANSQKDWKCIIGDPVNVSALASSNTHSWRWDLEEGFPDAWNPIGGNSQIGTITIPITDMPNKNSTFGDAYGTVNVRCRDIENRIHIVYSDEQFPSKKLQVFYDGAKQDSPDNSVPNWFYYYKDNESGGDGLYTYNGTLGTSVSYPEFGDGSIQIAPNAYSGGTYLEYSHNPTGNGGQQLTLVGNSTVYMNYQYFFGVIKHEQNHANFAVQPTNSLDGDGDTLKDIDETATGFTDPTLKYSSGGTGPFDDGEVYAGGVIEKAAILAADLSRDWAIVKNSNIITGENW